MGSVLKRGTGGRDGGTVPVRKTSPSPIGDPSPPCVGGYVVVIGIIIIIIIVKVCIIDTILKVDVFVANNIVVVKTIVPKTPPSPIGESP